ncbi:MAG: DUF1064 domain-containing protein [Lachnospiraceae bacterium]|nr:DUF1064 domain-containing protein [Lachnospiraceae bacterium]
MRQYQTRSYGGYSKYKNNRVSTPYGEFDSGKEYNRFLVLYSKERSGKIKDLQRQVSFELVPAQKGPTRSERAVRYVADFVYVQDGKTVVEDVKGYKTPEYVIKRKLMLSVHGIEIKEV